MKNMQKRKVAAVICEYDPFHAGHMTLLTALRRALGEDTAIVAIMSGNYTQRGEPALFPKTVRAACAVHGGADLVLELPFPYSCSGAERFADAGVHIANSIGVVDYLFFGSECGTVAPLLTLAQRLESDAFLQAYTDEGDRNATGCAAKTEVIYRRLFGEQDPLLPLLHDPNNILGISYIRSLLRTESKILPLTFPRTGMRHDEKTISDNAPFTSASAARDRLRHGDVSALDRLPSATKTVLQNAVSNGNLLAPDDRWLMHCIFHYRNCNKEDILFCDGFSSGLGDRILRAANENATPEAFFAALRNKKHTDAYLRRALLYGVFGISRTHLNTPPAYTQILAMNARGQEILSSARRHASIRLLNRPSEINHLPAELCMTAQKSVRADSVYCALLSAPARPCDLFRYTPYREKG